MSTRNMRPGEAAFFDHRERVEIGDDADFGGHDDEVVFGHVVAARAQAVAVEHRARSGNRRRR
jgi:hypothetical protein